MEEFTNGTSPTAACKAGTSHPEWETFCPYCGWVYDQPETVIPDHASCGHLVATTQWTEGAYQLNIGAVAGIDGRWSFWQASQGHTSREAIEHALRQVNVKVDSATAVADAWAGRTWCRYYFSRRADVAVQELVATAQPALISRAPHRHAPCQMRA